MLQHISLQYDKLTEHCGTLIGEIADCFKASLTESIHSYRSAGSSKGVGLAMAGITMLGHYMDAAQRKAGVQRELENLKNDIKHDATMIRGDYARLAAIYKTLNDIYIPKANAFYRYAARVMTKELDALFASLYNSQEVKQLVAERDALLVDIRNLQNAIAYIN